jgi:O-antigen ligase
MEPPGRQGAILVILSVAGGAAAGAGALPITAAVMFVAGAVIAFENPPLVPAFLALLLPLGFAVTSVAGVQIALLHSAVFGAAGGYLLRLNRDRRRPELGLSDAIFGVFVLGVALSGAGPVAKAPWLHDLALWASLGVVFHCSARVLAEQTARRRLYIALATAALFEAGYAIAQFVAASHSRFSRLGGAIVYPQPKATLQHPNALGAFLVFALLVLVGVALSGRNGWRLAWLGAVLVVGLGTVAPFSRGAWISLAGGGLALILVERRHRRVLGGIAAGLVVAAGAFAVLDNGALGARLSSIFSGDVSSLYGFRGTLAHRALDVIAAHPLTGAGRFSEVGTYAGRPTLATHPHDLLLGVGVFFGIPAALAFAALLALAVRATWRASRVHDARLALEGAAVFAALAGLFVNGLFEYPFWNTTLTVEIALLLSLAIALERARTQHVVTSNWLAPRIRD